MSTRRLILWDFDGTLADNSGRWSATLLSLVRERVPYFPATAEAIRAGMRGRFPWHEPEVLHREWTPADWWGTVTRRLAESVARLGLDEADARAAAAAFRARYLEPARWRIFPDVEPALRALSAAGFRHAVLSNHVPELPELARALGLSTHFEAVFTSGLTGVEKPNPRAFREALAALGNAAETVMVGDNYDADVAGAEAVGLRAILVRTGDERAATRCAGLAEVAALLAAG